MEQKRKIKPPIYLLLALLLMEAMHRWLPLGQLWGTPLSYAGIALLVLGAVMTILSAAAFQRAGTGIVPFEEATALVTSGFFRHTRNPMYLGMVLILLGVAVLRGSLGAFLPIPLFVWVIQSQFIHGEERFMEAAFGGAYLDYKRRVRRWL